MSPDPTMTGADAALRVLARVEELAADATGALIFGIPDEAQRGLLIERGRVCWATVGLRQRLTDLLSRACVSPLDAAETLSNSPRFAPVANGSAGALRSLNRHGWTVAVNSCVPFNESLEYKP